MKLKKNVTTATIAFLVMLCIACYLSLVNVINSPNLNSIKEFLKCLILSASYIALAGLLWRSNYTRIISLCMIILWVLNLAISFIFYFLFETGLDDQLAMTILSSNLNESKDFIISYWHFVLFILLIFIVSCCCVSLLSKNTPKRGLIILSSIVILTVGYKAVELIARGKLQEPNFLMSERLFPYMSLGNYSVFIRNYEDLTILNSVNENKPIYQLEMDDTGTDIYVLVVGESVRRDHVSLNGYTRLTMPNMENRKSQLFIFDQAISAAPITTMAVTSALTTKPVDSDDYLLLSDNIINLANQAGYKTYWYSIQGSLGQYNSVITSIAKMADELEWLDTNKHDDIFLPKIKEALDDNSFPKKKKLIVIHTNGSHFIACNQYPIEEKYFTGGESVIADCYDDSIRFTDKILEQIFVLLENKAASVFYFSDHGQIRRMKRGELDYFHGSINPSKESIEVPQFIWYSPVLSTENKKIGRYPLLYSTSENYNLLANWLGIKKIDQQLITSPLVESYIPKDNFIIMNTRSNIFNYYDLKSDKSVGIK